MAKRKPRSHHHHLWLDQYGNRFWAAGRKELQEQIPGKVSIMYRDKPDGRVVRCGYVIGQHWLTEFAPVEGEA
jgi:hypothetical protein